MWVRDEKKLNTQCSKVNSKDVRAVRSDCTTQEPRRALRITRLFCEILFSCLRRTRLERKSTNIHPKSTPNRRKIDLGPFWALQAASGTRPDALGTAFNTQMPPQNRSWGALGEPRVAKSRPKASPGHPRDAPRLLRLSEPLWCTSCTERRRTRLRIDFLIAFVLSRESSDVLGVSVFTMFCWVSTKLTRNASERPAQSKIMLFRLPKSSLGASAGPKNEPKRPSD